MVKKFKKPRKVKNKTFTKNKRPNKTIQCQNCNFGFTNLLHFRAHIKSKPQCKQNNSFACKFCDYVGLNDLGLQSHLNKKARCKLKYLEFQSTLGKLPDTSQATHLHSNSNDNLGIRSNSYKIQSTYPSSSINDIVFNINENNITTLPTINSQINPSDINITDMNQFYKQSRLMSGIQNNKFSSIYELQGNLHNTNDTNVMYENSTSVLRNNHQSSLEVYNENDQEVLNELYQDLQSDNSSSDTDSEMSTVIFNTEDVLQFDQLSPTTNNITHVTSSKQNNPSDIRYKQQSMVKRFNELTLNPSDVMMLDLFHTLKASNAPNILFDRMIAWMQKHEMCVRKHGTDHLMKRNKFINDLDQKLYTDRSFMKPIVSPVNLTSGRSTTVVNFSLKDAIIRMVSNKSIFCPKNLLLDPLNPCGPPPISDHYNEVNSGTWHDDARKHECSESNHILMPFCCFIDGLKVDKFGKLTVEAVLSCCLWFNRAARNRTSSWFVSGFIQDQTLFRDQSSYVRDDKAQDYHNMLSHIFKDFKQLRDNGGISMTLDFGNNNKHDVVAIPVLQYVIGDCKGNDLLCGRMGGHSLNMKGLCRDCDVKPCDGDAICIGEKLKCKFHTMPDIVSKSPSELKDISFLPINNCFSQLSFGGCKRNILGGTPAEILHQIELGLCEYVADAVECLFTQSCIDIISKTVSGIVSYSQRQSERNLPNITTFKQGLLSVKSLKAKERFARVYMLFLALSNSHCINQLCKKRKRCDQDNTTATLLTRDFMRGFYNVIQDVILFHEWLKISEYKKSDFVVHENENDCRAQKRIKEFLQTFKTYIVRKGNNLKTPKFHQVLHIVDYIIRHGSPMNYDGSRGEYFGKTKIKDNAQLTNKQRETLNFDISRRLTEEDIVDEISAVYFQNYGEWPSKFCNINVDKDMCSIEKKTRPRFHLKSSVDNSLSTENENEINVDIDWGGASRTPTHNFPHEILKNLIVRLFIGSPNIGGKVRIGSQIAGYTETKIDSVTYRCHPCYAKKGSWYDWAYFQWEGHDKPIPARMMMILDFSDTDIIYSDKNNNEIENYSLTNHTFHHLTKEKWVVVLAASGSQADNETLTDDHFDSSIIERIELHNDNDMWLIPLSTLVGPCYVVYDNNFLCNRNIIANLDHEKRTAYVVQPMNKWGNIFLPNKQ